MLIPRADFRAMYFVYIMASRPGGALYLGLNRDLARRVEQHRSGHGSIHTVRYRNRTLVWFRTFDDLGAAQAHERRMKKWRRGWKIDAILSVNQDWRDLSGQIPYS